MQLYRRLTASLIALIAAASLPIAAAAAEHCPEVADRWPAGPADAVFTRAGRAYFGSGTVLTIGDVSVPSSPVVLGEIDLGMLIHDIVVEDQIAWVAAGNMVAEPGTVFRIDVADPAAPEVVAAWETQLPARSIAVGDDVVYAGLVDPIDPGHGVILELEPGATPASPPRITSVEIAGWPERLKVAEETLWVAELGTGARGFDVAEEGQLIELIHLAGNIRDLDAVDELLYLAEWRDDEPDVLRILDVADPSQPTSLAEYRADRARKVRIVGPTAYVASSPVESSIRLELVNVSDPSDPRREDVLSLGSLRGEAFLHDFAVANRIACISNSRGGPWLVEDPPTGEPRLVGSFSTPGVTEAVTRSGELLAVAGGESGLLLFDLAGAHGLVPLTLPEAVGGFAKDVAIAGDVAYVASWRDGVLILDLSDPRAPVEIARAATDRALLSGRRRQRLPLRHARDRALRLDGHHRRLRPGRAQPGVRAPGRRARGGWGLCLQRLVGLGRSMRAGDLGRQRSAAARRPSPRASTSSAAATAAACPGPTTRGPTSCSRTAPSPGSPWPAAGAGSRSAPVASTCSTCPTRRRRTSWRRWTTLPAAFRRPLLAATPPTWRPPPPPAC